ncbi:MAG: RHS repeat-associated core domain-containing protein, partial [Ignavibacteria bacterium]
VYDENGDQQYVNLLGADVFGKYVPDEAEYYFYVKDHLGSTRVVVDGSGNPKEAYEYYPFGKIARSITSAGINVDEKFTGKELDDDNEERLYYFGARYYDGDLGRWPSPDPRADKSLGVSPYNYVLGNPMRLVDKDGKEGDDYIEALYANRESLSPEGQKAFDETFTTTMSVEVGLLAGTYGAVRYGPAISGFISTNANRIRNFVNRTFNNVKELFRSSESPYDIAQKGGRHAGQLRQFGKQTIKELQKSISSFGQNISKHEGWIKDPLSKVKNWNQLSKTHQESLIHHWKQDIQRSKELLEIAKEELKNR